MDLTSKLRQEINFLQQKLDYQQNLLQDERRVTDNLIVNKNKAIEGLQSKLDDLQKSYKTACDQFKAERADAFKSMQDEFTVKLEKELKSLDKQKSLVGMEAQEQISKMKLKLTDESNKVAQKYDKMMRDLRESHRKELQRHSAQHEQSVEAVVAAHRAELTSVKNDARKSIESAQKRADLNGRLQKNKFDEEMLKLQQSLGEKDAEISRLKQKVVSQSMTGDKKKDVAVKEYEKKMAELENECQEKIKEGKRSLTETVKKLEQRCFRFESEKTAVKAQHEADLERLKVSHKNQLDQQLQQRNHMIEDLRKDFAQKTRDREERHRNSLEEVERNHAHEINSLRLQFDRQIEVGKNQLTDEIQVRNRRVEELEKEVQKMKMQISLQDTFWRKKERSTAEEMCEQIAMLKKVNKSMQESHDDEVKRLRAILDARDREIQNKDSARLLALHDVSELRKNFDLQSIERQKENIDLGQQFQNLHMQIKQLKSTENALLEKIKYLEKDIAMHLDTIDELRETIKGLEVENTEWKTKAEYRKSVMAQTSPSRSPVKFIVKDDKLGDDYNNEFDDKKVTWVSSFGDIGATGAGAEADDQQSLLIDMPTDFELLMNGHYQANDENRNHNHQVDETFEHVRKDLQDVIQSHIDRIENLTDELQKTRKL